MSYLTQLGAGTATGFPSCWFTQKKAPVTVLQRTEGVQVLPCPSCNRGLISLGHTTQTRLQVNHIGIFQKQTSNFCSNVKLKISNSIPYTRESSGAPYLKMLLHNLDLSLVRTFLQSPISIMEKDFDHLNYNKQENSFKSYTRGPT